MRASSMDSEPAHAQKYDELQNDFVYGPSNEVPGYNYTCRYKKHCPIHDTASGCVQGNTGDARRAE